MSFNYANADNVQGIIPALQSGASTVGPISGEYPLFQVSSPVDASGMEMAFVCLLDATTVGTQVLATAASTVVLKPYDGNTTAAAASDNNELFNVIDFSNSGASVIAGQSWSAAHNSMKATGTSTTDLDADDWVNLDVAANITGAGGFGVIGYTAFFVHGVPGAVA